MTSQWPHYCFGGLDLSKAPLKESVAMATAKESTPKLLPFNKFQYIFRKSHQIWLNYLSPTLSYGQETSRVVPTTPGRIGSIPCFWLIFANFQKEVDCLSVESLIDRDRKWLFFMSWSNFGLLLLNPSQISWSKINVMVTFLWLIKRVYFFLSHPVCSLANPIWIGT